MIQSNLKAKAFLGVGTFLLSVVAIQAQAPSSTAALQLTADEHDGNYSLSAPGIANPVLRAGVAAKVDGRGLHAADYPRHEVTTDSETGELGAARVARIRYASRAGAPDLLLKVRTYTSLPFGDMQLSAINATGQSVQVQAFRLLEVRSRSVKRGEGSLLELGGPPTSDRVLSDSFSEDRPALQLRDLINAEKKVHRAVGVQLVYNQQSHQSWFIGALTSDKFLSVLRLHMGEAAATAITSYEVNSTGTTELLLENSLLTSPAKDRVELSLTLSPGAELASERMLFSVGTDYHLQLETYARLVRDLHHARVSAPRRSVGGAGRRITSA